MARPTKYNENIRDRILELAEQGATDEQIGKDIGVSHHTIKTWKGKHPEFRTALKEAKDVPDELVEVTLFQRACGYTCEEVKVFHYQGEVITKTVEKHYAPDPTSMIFWLKNRRPERWRDKREVELDTGNITVLFDRQDKDL